MSQPNSKLFQHLQIGNMELSTRIVMGPLSSNLADENNVLNHFTKEYYGVRAQVPGTLIIGEATFISAAASGTEELRAGIWTEAQCNAWREVVSAVQDKGSFIFLQLWALGRSADPEVKRRQGTGDVVSSSAIPEEPDKCVPRALTEDEIHQYIDDYVAAAKSAVHVCGFDGVEIHGGNGSLVDQFTQSCVNQRTDTWGASVENRNHFALAIIQGICAAVGKERVGFRMTPWSTYGGMGMNYQDTIKQFSDLVNGLKDLDIAYLHLVESRIAGRADVEGGESLDPFIELWTAKPLILAGGYDADTAKIAVDETYHGRYVAIAFGRAFVTNPDLVQRLKDGTELVEG